jgi:hypothetical protein
MIPSDNGWRRIVYLSRFASSALVLIAGSSPLYAEKLGYGSRLGMDATVTSQSATDNAQIRAEHTTEGATRIAMKQAAPSTSSSPFSGVWLTASEDMKPCKASDIAAHDNDGMIQVFPKEVRYWEASCKIKRMKMVGEATGEVEMDCGGEGMRWKAREIWHTARVGRTKQLIMINLLRSDEIDETGKKIKNPNAAKPSVAVFAACDGS